MYDIIFIGNDSPEWKKLKARFRTAKRADSFESAMKKAFTKMVWVVWNDLIIADDFNFDYEADEWSLEYVHTFLNGNQHDGIILVPKDVNVSIREIQHRFFVNKKELDIVASTPLQYDQFIVETYDDYLYAMDNSKTELFWANTNNIDTSNFKFELYFSHHNQYDRHENHAFIHRVNEQDYYNGLFLLSKHKPITKKEIDYRHLVSCKEWDIVASTPLQYDQFIVETYDDYLYAMDNSKTELFWANTNNIDTSNFKFDLYLSHDNYDRHENHAFIHRVNEQDYYNGLFLLSKHKPITKKEIDYRHLVSRKEWDIVASKPMNYSQFNIDTYDDYLYALENSKTEMFYAISSQINIIKIPNLYFSHDDEYNRKENHAFQNICNGLERYNGIFLLSKHKPVSKKEIEHRHIVNKKTWDTIASKHKPYDVVFMSYNEINADENYEMLLEKAPHATRVHGVKGIHQAHIQAAKQSTSEMVWIVDADALLMDDFNFEFFVEKWDRETVHVWRSKNPINNLVYGYGGIKLFPRLLTINMDISKPDMTTSISNKFKAMQEVSNVTAFNTDPFNTWKSAFRECCKLASKIIDRQKSKETEERLDVWCTIGKDKPFGAFAIQGAKAGREYGYQNKDNTEALKKINDFDWLREKFNKIKI